MSNNNPGEAQRVLCPIETVIFWEQFPTDDNQAGSVKEIVPKENGFLPTRHLDNCLHRGQFLLKLIVKDTELFQLSNPFTVRRQNGENVITPLSVNFQGNGVKTFRQAIKVRIKKKYPKFRTDAYDNNVMFAAVKGNRLIMYGVGIASQKEQFFLLRKNQYDVGLYKFRGKIVIPELPDWKTLPDLIKDMVDVQSLPKRSEYVEPAIDTSAARGDKGVILWSDPFAEKASIITEQGEALLPFTSIRNHGKNLTNPKPGAVVKFSRLQEPYAGSTTFGLVALGIEVL